MSFAWNIQIAEFCDHLAYKPRVQRCRLELRGQVVLACFVLSPDQCLLLGIGGRKLICRTHGTGLLGGLFRPHVRSIPRGSASLPESVDPKITMTVCNTAAPWLLLPCPPLPEDLRREGGLYSQAEQHSLEKDRVSDLSLGVTLKISSANVRGVLLLQVEQNLLRVPSLRCSRHQHF